MIFKEASTFDDLVFSENGHFVNSFISLESVPISFYQYRIMSNEENFNLYPNLLWKRKTEKNNVTDTLISNRKSLSNFRVLEQESMTSLSTNICPIDFAKCQTKTFETKMFTPVVKQILLKKGINYISPKYDGIRGTVTFDNFKMIWISLNNNYIKTVKFANDILQLHSFSFSCEKIDENVFVIFDVNIDAVFGVRMKMLNFIKKHYETKLQSKNIFIQQFKQFDISKFPNSVISNMVNFKTDGIIISNTLFKQQYKFKSEYTIDLQLKNNCWCSSENIPIFKNDLFLDNSDQYSKMDNFSSLLNEFQENDICEFLLQENMFVFKKIRKDRKSANPLQIIYLNCLNDTIKFKLNKHYIRLFLRYLNLSVLFHFPCLQHSKCF